MNTATKTADAIDQQCRRISSKLTARARHILDTQQILPELDLCEVMFMTPTERSRLHKVELIFMRNTPGRMAAAKERLKAKRAARIAKLRKSKNG